MMKIRLSWVLLAILVDRPLAGRDARAGRLGRADRRGDDLLRLHRGDLAGLVGGPAPAGAGGRRAVRVGLPLPVFGVEARRWVDVAPTTTAVQELATALVARPSLAPGERFEVRVDDGQLKADFTGGAGDGTKVERASVAIKEEGGESVRILVQHNQGAGLPP